MPIADIDVFGENPESQISLPWSIENPQATYLLYECWIETTLDAGFALHKTLPQDFDNTDTLASGFIDDPDLDLNVEGVNLFSASSGVDTIQRMSTSTYLFRLRGYAMRVGYQIPIPGVKSIGGQTPVPGEKQWAYNRIIGNFSGIPLWGAEWDLEYITAKSPQVSANDMGNAAQGAVPPNLAAHIRGDVQLPDTIALPWTNPDQNAVPARTLIRTI